ncbi:3',5'-cyclic-nucleotide phosphodiesterase [Mucilaginibacter gracilis]|uniref:3',5'-cyclic-nucleotide phosphodiesterase n=1 Tax=Mucilaginibacter gracilis TaxID=423350 RepID=A0A495J893_9SPHI|nr:3',5'-cyclic-nucleotide phosphodiesterase [Mucilaginibacter gracilis]RKR84971.1 3',5'-cyclic-nucleotide phosphodiesterase [Mucilaginibacter gracilis]
MINKTCKVICTILLTTAAAFAQIKPAFKVVPLGVYGGSDESNLSAYMVAPTGSNNYACMDAGTLQAGLEKAVKNHVFTVPADTVLKRYIKGYFISHAHLDHVAGMIINSPDDAAKKVYGLKYTLDVLRDNYFTWKNWANFGSDGDKPVLNKYHYTPLNPGEKTPIDNTTMSVQAFVLSHGNPYQSTAFLVESNGSYILYLGDTGADEIEKSDKLRQLWQYIAPLVKAKTLKAIMIEVSFANQQPDKSLFGHLTPRLLMNEMAVLSTLAGPNAVEGLPVVVTHLKPAGGHIADIKKQLAAANTLQLKLIYPQQGKMLEF